jgi:trypsin
MTFLGSILTALALVSLAADVHAGDVRALSEGDASRIDSIMTSRSKPTVTPKIVGGKPAPERPWTVALALRKPDGSLFQYCGGTLVGKHWVLTAVHCDVRAGEIAIVGRRKLSDKAAGKEIAIKSVINNPSYDADTNANDVALVELSEDATSAPLPLASSATSVAAGTRVKVIGWGLLREKGKQSDELMEVEVPVVAKATCKAQYAVAQIDIKPSMVCAGETGKDSCQGDSGGPLTTKDTSKLVGIVSFGIGCARPDFPGVYTRVSSFRAWIKDNSGI